MASPSASHGRFCFENQERLRASYDAYITKVMQRCFPNLHCLVNPVLSRNPLSSGLFQRFLRIEETGTPEKFKLSTWLVTRKLLSYYLKCGAYLALLVPYRLAYRFSKLRSALPAVDPERELHVIDTYLMVDQILTGGKFEDNYFGPLYQTLDRRDVRYFVLAILFGKELFGLSNRRKTYDILAKDGRGFVTEFDLLTAADYLKLAAALLLSPFASLRLLGQDFDPRYDGALKSELVANLDKIQAIYYLRYLVGRRVAHLSRRRVTVISRYENLAWDRLFLRGLRDAGGPARAFGCQFYVLIPMLLNLYPLEEEARYGILPDRILVSGPEYAGRSAALGYGVGFAPRMDYMLRTPERYARLSNREGIVVLLTYNVEESQGILELLRASPLGSRADVLVKLHSVHYLIRPDFRIPEVWTETRESISELCGNAKVVITGGSSTGVEAAAMGCSVVIVGNPEGITYNPMPDLGRGEIWEVAFTSEDLGQALRRLEAIREDRLQRIEELVRMYRERCITEATDERIAEALDLLRL